MKVFYSTANVCPISHNLTVCVSALVTLTAAWCVAVAISVGYGDCTWLSHLAARTSHTYKETISFISRSLQCSAVNVVSASTVILLGLSCVYMGKELFIRRSVAYPGILFGGVQKIQLRTERTGIWRR
jgi:hypothetical protein